VRVAFVALGLAEPRVLVGGVAGDEVEHHADAELLRLGEERVEVVVGAVAWGDAVEVGHVVAGIAEWRHETRVQPDRVDAEVMEVGQLLDDPAEVADAVAVGVAEGLRVDLVEDGVFEPGGRRLGDGGGVSGERGGGGHGEEREEVAHGRGVRTEGGGGARALRANVVQPVGARPVGAMRARRASRGRR